MVGVNNRAKNAAETLNLGPLKILGVTHKSGGLEEQNTSRFQVGAVGLVCAQSFESSGELPLGRSRINSRHEAVSLLLQSL